MSKRIDLVYLGDMLDAARRVAAKVDGKTIGDFQTDDNLQLAVVHLIQVIGESASRVSAAIREENSTLPWDAVIGMRNRLVHDYGNVDYSIVWRVAVEEIPKLISVLAQIVPPSP